MQFKVIQEFDIDGNLLLQSSGQVQELVEITITLSDGRTLTINRDTSKEEAGKLVNQIIHDVLEVDGYPEINLLRTSTD